MSLDKLNLELNENVVHPFRDLPEIKSSFLRANDRFLEWMANHVLASMLMFDIALIVPLIAIPMSDSVKITLGVISGSWIQWWALPALQSTQVKADVKREAKADADHIALTHIANVVDEILERMNAHPASQAPR